jgi:hypothetical protein
MASTTNSPRVEETSASDEARPPREETRTRLFRPGAHVRETPVDEPVETTDRPPVVVADDRVDDAHVDEARVDETPVDESRAVSRRGHTSPAATFSLIFGVVAAYTAVLVFLTPADIVLGVVAVLLGVVGMRVAAKPGVTGRWVAALGVLLGLGAILLGTLTATGTHTVLNGKGAVDRVQQQVDQWRDRVNHADLSDGIG